MTTLRIGYVGLGAMGGALARRLLLSAPLIVYNRSPERRAAFAAPGVTIPGVTIAASPAAVGASADIVFLCLPTSREVRRVIFATRTGVIRGMRPGGMIVDQTSGDPAATRAMAAELAAHGVALIDAPVSGGPRGAEAGTIAIMVGASPLQFAAVSPVLRKISPNVAHVGPLGAGHMLKALNNLISAGNRLLAFEAIGIAAAAGMDPRIVLETINRSSGRNHATMTVLPEQILTDNFESRSALATMEKDLVMASRFAANGFAELSLSRAILQRYRLAIRRFGRDADLHEVFRLYEAAAGMAIAPKQPEAGSSAPIIHRK